MSTSGSTEGVNATRMELLNTRKKVKLAQHGYSLLKEKMDALIIEFYEAIDDAKTSRQEAFETLKEAYESLAKAKFAVGERRIKEIAMSSPEAVEIEPDLLNIMGVKVPVLNLKINEKHSLFYSITTTSASLDSTVSKFQDAIKAIVKMAEKFATLQKLAYEINRTKRRVNALNHIVIPHLESIAQYIELTLQEIERENFTKLKHIKSKLEKEATHQ